MKGSIVKFLGIISILFSVFLGILNSVSAISYIVLILGIAVFLYFLSFSKTYEKDKNQQSEIFLKFLNTFGFVTLSIFITLFLSVVYGRGFSRFVIFIVLIQIAFLGILGLIFTKKINKTFGNTILRLAVEKDVESILQMYLDGSNSLKEDGVDQWQGEYVPTIKDVDEHFGIDLYVLDVNGEVVSTACLVEGIDLDYENIEGKWHTKIPYISIHKVATSNKYKKQGYGKIMMQEIEKLARNRKLDLRIDTHEDNKKMIKFIKSCGYSYCGVVILEGKLKRFAYDKITEEEKVDIKKEEIKVQMPMKCGW